MYRPLQPKVRRGQSVFEYIILLAAVIVVLIVFLSPTGPFRYSVENILSQTVDQFNNIVNSTNQALFP